MNDPYEHPEPITATVKSLSEDAFLESKSDKRRRTFETWLAAQTAGSDPLMPESDKEAWKRVHAFRFSYLRRFGRFPRHGHVMKRLARERDKA